MPYTPPGIVSVLNSYPNHPAYFENLEDFEVYLKDLPRPIPPPASPLRPRINHLGDKGKLCVCHDMMGGYPNDAHNPMWTMNWWAIADTFIYFSHHRVSPPPRQFISAGHRQGCKVLGTLILEGESDRYRVLMGNDTTSISPQTNNISKKYADHLIDLCELRGFDGYLLNFEVSYENSHNARLLGAWVAYLTSESRRRLGADRSVIMWYDSVTVNGNLRWQNTLNQLNSAFFIASDSLFTNYNYSSGTIPTAKEFLQNLVEDTRPKSDVSWGIDMWGRGTYQGGGYRTCLALDTIQPGLPPQQHGFSASLFAPGYLWENDTLQPHDRPSWWARDTLLWAGRATEAKTNEALKKLNTDPAKQLGPGEVFHPLKKYFPFQAQTLPFATNFSLGAGTFFNVQGQNISSTLRWTDHEWVAPLPDLAVPSTVSAYQLPGMTFTGITLPVALECEWISDPGKVWTGSHSLQLSFVNQPVVGTISVPLISVDLASGPEHGCVIMFEVTWYLASQLLNTSVENLSIFQGDKYTSSSYQTVTQKAPERGWFKTTAFFDNLKGVVGFGIDVNFAGRAEAPVVLGALSVTAVSGSASGNVFTPHITYIDPTDVDIQFDDNTEAATLIWRSNIRPPFGQGSTNANPAWPTIPQTTLNEDEIIYEVTTSLVAPNKTTQSVLAWGTTSLGRQTVSWADPTARQKIFDTEAQGGFIAFKVQALNGSGWYAGSAAELSASFRDRKRLH
ncbi:hypothetical protein DACRYDRAFT_21286 [Dacryopinax primogenitus]|uniref:Cytosolic endo-beta-N-acetylglucosaminidase TIM barrel domain-containing protein n=1 Tax=Dacryopinax primogenitus (strain DJM 731) TaxID=1858805 RepID=M5GCG1_DACPD|nr:uncharacterized protein DACRYDRAFT_21286 [Dacryopinax primogenitus]EJU03867.1 hypothetical protein DACRYDRAFT_21286 [Dacryopinax primogenitus]